MEPITRTEGLIEVCLHRPGQDIDICTHPTERHCTTISQRQGDTGYPDIIILRHDEIYPLIVALKEYKKALGREFKA